LEAVVFRGESGNLVRKPADVSGVRVGCDEGLLGGRVIESLPQIALLLEKRRVDSFPDAGGGFGEALGERSRPGSLRGVESFGVE
jgi:hypothetical protein